MRLDYIMLKISRYTILGLIVNAARRVYVTIFEETYTVVTFDIYHPCICTLILILESNNRCDS